MQTNSALPRFPVFRLGKQSASLQTAPEHRRTKPQVISVVRTLCPTITNSGWSENTNRDEDVSVHLAHFKPSRPRERAPGPDFDLLGDMICGKPLPPYKLDCMGLIFKWDRHGKAGTTPILIHSALGSKAMSRKLISYTVRTRSYSVKK